jgi:hypothetical protein
MLGSFYSSPSVWSSYDDIIAHDYPTANVSITWNEFQSEMSVDIKTEKNNFMVYVNFFYKDKRTDFLRLDGNVVSVLVNEYQQHVTKLVEDKKQFLNKRKETWNAKSILMAIKNITKIRKIAERLFQDLRSVSVYTIHASKNNAMARTTVELDADIITIIAPELLEVKIKNNWLKLHSINVVLANYLFVYRMKKFVSVLKAMTNLARIASVVLWIVSTAIALLSGILSPVNDLNPIYRVIISVFNFVGVPTLLVKFIPKILGYVIRHTVLKKLHMQ